MSGESFYVSTPIYYVNELAHIGHVFTTAVADVVARFHRLRGLDTFFLTGTDEHAAKVAEAAAKHGRTPQDWADECAQGFQEAFARFGMSHDDFIRTSQERHTQRVRLYIAELLESDDVYAGTYEGWYDPGQEEYVPESRARESDYRSPISGKPLVRKHEKNYFFRLSAYADALRSWLNENPDAVQPEARRHEVLGRIEGGLNDVPISRSGSGGWGIAVPGDPEQTIYVWIDALFNYLTAVDTDERRHYWPCDVHFIGKDILWFHAVVWPAVLLALRKRPGFAWVELPRCVYAHSFWIAEGIKMSKSSGNFVDLDELDAYVADFGLDALRYFLATRGPLGSTDSDFARARFVEVYNGDLANTFGNSLSRVCSMARRYLEGRFTESVLKRGPCREAADRYVPRAVAAYENLELDEAAAEALTLVRSVDLFIQETEPFKLAKDPACSAEVGPILHQCAEALRLAALLLWPMMPERMIAALRRLGCAEQASMLAETAAGRLDPWLRWGGLELGNMLEAGPPLFPRRGDAEAQPSAKTGN